jgi:hypothetical protein
MAWKRLKVRRRALLEPGRYRAHVELGMLGAFVDSDDVVAAVESVGLQVIKATAGEDTGEWWVTVDVARPVAGELPEYVTGLERRV